jgi:hypothetical protein
MAQDPAKIPRSLLLEINKEQLETFEACQKALDHDEPEQTFNLMVNMLVQAIALTNKDNPTVYLYTRNKHKTDFTHVRCPDCKKEVPIVHQISDGFRETGFKLVT